jgi:adenylate cyclase class IV
MVEHMSWKERALKAEAEVERLKAKIGNAEEGVRMLAEIGHQQSKEVQRYREIYGPLPLTPEDTLTSGASHDR